MNLQSLNLIIISEEDLHFITASLEEIKQQLKDLNEKATNSLKYIIASEFMTAVRIRMTKFDELVKGGR